MAGGEPPTGREPTRGYVSAPATRPAAPPARTSQTVLGEKRTSTTGRHGQDDRGEGVVDDDAAEGDDDDGHDGDGGRADAVEEAGGPGRLAEAGDEGVGDGDEQERGQEDAERRDDGAGEAIEDVADEGGGGEDGAGGELADGDGVDEGLLGEPAAVRHEVGLEEGDEDVAAAVEACRRS